MGEPAENPAPPRKRRRRWLIVALLLVLVSGVAWWEWPRGDARFVGKWMLTDENSGESFQLAFWANGSGYAVTPDGRRHYFSWAVEDDDLRWGSDQPKWIPEWIWSQFVGLRRKVTGVAFFPFEWTRKIVSVDRDEIHVLAESRRQLLRRIPE